MGEIYLVKCLACDLEFKFERGLGGSTVYPKVRFYCEECGNISMEPQCKLCEKYLSRDLSRVVFPLEGFTIKIHEEGNKIRVKCPHCASDQTVLTLLDKWVMDYQIW